MHRPSQIWKKSTILGNLRNITEEGKKGNYTNEPIFFQRFKLWLFVIFIFVFENCQNSFSWGLPLVHSGLQNTWILEVKAVRSEFCLVRFRNIHIKESQKPGFTFSINWRTKFVWTHVLNMLNLWEISFLAFWLFVMSSSWNLLVKLWGTITN